MNISEITTIPCVLRTRSSNGSVHLIDTLLSYLTEIQQYDISLAVRQEDCRRLRKRYTADIYALNPTGNKIITIIHSQRRYWQIFPPAACTYVYHYFGLCSSFNQHIAASENTKKLNTLRNASEAVIREERSVVAERSRLNAKMSHVRGLVGCLYGGVGMASKAGQGVVEREAPKTRTSDFMAGWLGGAIEWLKELWVDKWVIGRAEYMRLGLSLPLDMACGQPEHLQDWYWQLGPKDSYDSREEFRKQYNTMNCAGVKGVRANDDGSSGERSNAGVGAGEGKGRSGRKIRDDGKTREKWRQ